MAQDVTRQTEIKNCAEFFPCLFSLTILKQEATLVLRGRFFVWLIFLYISLPRMCWRFSDCLAFPHCCMDMPPALCKHWCFTSETHWAFRGLWEVTTSSRLAPGWHELKAASELRDLVKPWLSSTLTITFLHSSMIIRHGFSSRWSPFHSKISQSQASSIWPNYWHPHPSSAPLWHTSCIIALSALTSPLQTA